MGTYLAHHGILGMKWGVRRYQNKDGTLTTAGKKRYSEGTRSKPLSVELWGRTLDLASSDDPKTITQKHNFLRNTAQISAESLPMLKKYISEHDGDRLPNGPIDNVFKYVVPKSLYVPRDAGPADYVIQAKYKFDPEHGIAICVSNNHVATITDEPGSEFASWWAAPKPNVFTEKQTAIGQNQSAAFMNSYGHLGIDTLQRQNRR